MKALINWIKALLSNNEEVSSKRLVTVTCLILIVFSVVAHVFGMKIDAQILWPLVSLCGASIGLTITKDILSKPPIQ